MQKPGLRLNSISQDRLGASRLYSVNPLIGCIEGFVPDSVIEEIEAAVQDVQLRRATVARHDGPAVDENRTALNYKVPPGTIPPVDFVTARAAGIFRLKKHLCEYPEYIRYEEGQEFKRHFDASLSGSMTGRDAEDSARSQRVFTAILYLNHDFTGGSTVFPRVDIELQPKRGTLAFWQNTKPGSDKVHHLSMHQGCPVQKGCKRVISFWFRDRPWQPYKAE